MEDGVGLKRDGLRFSRSAHLLSLRVLPSGSDAFKGKLVDLRASFSPFSSAGGSQDGVPSCKRGHSHDEAESLPTSTFTVDAENPQGSPCQSAGSASMTIVFSPPTGTVERRTRHLPLCPCSKWMGRSLRSSNAINRYVGKLADLYPSDPWQAALCDEIMEAVEDINTKIGATFFLPEEQKKAQRTALVKGPIPFYLTRLQQRLEAHGGQYFADNRLTVADLKVFVWIRHLSWVLSIMFRPT